MDSKLAVRHHCSLRDHGSGSTAGFHTARNGKPRSKRCTYCAGALIVETGLWGVFEWQQDDRYGQDRANGTYGSETAAQRHADTLNATEAKWVVRWIPVQP